MVLMRDVEKRGWGGDGLTNYDLCGRDSVSVNQSANKDALRFYKQGAVYTKRIQPNAEPLYVLEPGRYLI